MNLKVKILKWFAGVPVAMLNTKTAEKIGAHLLDRISIKTKNREMSTIIDTIGNLVKENEIAVSSEIVEELQLKNSQRIEISLVNPPRSLEFIKKKVNNKTLSESEIKEIINDVVENNLSESEIALFISGMYKQGMNFKETVFLIKAILETGNQLHFDSKFVVDKHSIGGIPGNRTTPIVVSICAAAGLTIPKSSSRAITTAAGTADVIETIAKIEFSLDEVKKIVKKTKACLVWGGGFGIVPADSKIIRIEKQLGIDPETQLLASIMSKKIASGAKYILIDIPYGKTAKVSKEKALRLKNKFEKLGKYFKKKLKVVLTKGEQPIGYGIGPFLEIRDVISVLKQDCNCPKDLEEKSIFLAGEIFKMTRQGNKETARQILRSGKAFEKFKEIIITQHGKVPEKIPESKFKKSIFSEKSGVLKEIHNKKINNLARTAGAPVDKLAGLEIRFKLDDKIKKGDELIVIHAESASRLKQAINFYKKEKPFLII